jgi:hypothetical protein
MKEETFVKFQTQKSKKNTQEQEQVKKYITQKEGRTWK